MSIVTAHHWLQNVCDPDAEFGGRWEYCARPFAFVDSSGEYWTIATDGYVIVALKGIQAGAAPLAKMPFASADFEKFLKPPDSPAATYFVQRLRQFAPRPKTETVCKKCDGRGDCSECGRDCEACGGGGGSYLKAAPGWLHGEPINRNYLGRFIHDVSDDLVTIQANGKCPEGTAKTLFLSGNGWVASITTITAGTGHESDEWKTAPKLDKRTS